MNIHKNARLTAHSRAELVRRVLEEGQSRKAVALAYGVCLRTVGKWVGRFRSEGWDGLADRSSRPARLHRPTSAAVVEQIAALRRQRRTGRQIALQVQVSPATVSRVLKRLGLNRLSALEPAAPVLRYERQKPPQNRLFFPERNVTMSALTEATVIVEAGETSGTLIQARAALHQNRKLFILDSCFQRSDLTWPARFAEQGAIRVRKPEDIWDNLA